MIAVTTTAATQIQKLLAKKDSATGLRVGIKAGGCSGFEYLFEWESAPTDTDLVFDGPDGVKVWVDARSHRLLDGTTLDYDTSLVSRGFIFQNPHAKQTCGCGTSFSV